MIKTATRMIMMLVAVLIIFFLLSQHFQDASSYNNNSKYWFIYIYITEMLFKVPIITIITIITFFSNYLVHTTLNSLVGNLIRRHRRSSWLGSHNYKSHKLTVMLYTPPSCGTKAAQSSTQVYWLLLLSGDTLIYRISRFRTFLLKIPVTFTRSLWYIDAVKVLFSIQRKCFIQYLYRAMKMV